MIKLYIYMTYKHALNIISSCEFDRNISVKNKTILFELFTFMYTTFDTKFNYRIVNKIKFLSFNFIIF